MFKKNKEKNVLLTSLRRRERPSTGQFAEMFDLMISMREYFIMEYEESKKAIEEAEKKAKEKAGTESFWSKKFSFNQMLFGTLFLGPAFGLLVFLLVYTRFN